MEDRRVKKKKNKQNKQGRQGIYSWGKETGAFVVSTREEVVEEGRDLVGKK